MSGIVVLAVILAAVLAVVLVLYVRDRLILARLHESILDAQEGTLEPLKVEVPPNNQLNALVKDFNVMMGALRSMFDTVEKCQMRVMNERNKMNALLQSLPGALLSIDDNLRVTAINSQTEDLFGCRSAELENHNLFDLLVVDERDREILRDAFLYKRQIHNHVLHTRLNNRELWLALNMSFLTEEDVGMDAVLIFQDITDYKNLQESVYYREKLVAMGQLAAGIAHELNTPLGNIIGYSQVLSDNVSDLEKQTHYTGIIVSEAKRCSRIVQDLLNYGRKDQCYGDGCNVNQLIRELLDTFSSCRLQRQPVDIDLDLDENEPLVNGGCGELDIVFTNLIINSLSALEGREEPLIRVRTQVVNNKEVLATVEDNGPGVSPEIRGRIFDPFFTTGEMGHESGLGLAISQAMIGRRGGSLRLDSSCSTGARFVIRLYREAK
ncbi:two-component system sensor histidine kinase NtrB [Thiohalophilus sp.]|uniref:two-component system sensor histidine kinase NtrB n=1 Tax=Thiohalophilus sp. TaxID=3028392 RepID=UPI002ACD5EDB|nr:histidine kinase dimerization/phospho-acceptor domain-containing protein [Thiohalophilus sp.]MDZ7662408.1 histidine kinase dimerization/phospho-acceptor domain-containing protein [Thiohalophilus sp.]